MNTRELNVSKELSSGTYTGQDIIGDITKHEIAMDMLAGLLKGAFIASNYSQGSLNKATLDTAYAAAYANGLANSRKVRLVIPPGTWTIGANADYSSYVDYVITVIMSGTMISHGAYIITIPNPDTGGRRFQWLTGAGQETFVGDCPEVPAEWFGAKAATLAAYTDCYAALVKACASKTGHVTVTLGEGIFFTSNTLTMNVVGTTHVIQLKGLGYQHTMLHHYGTQTTGCIASNGCILRDISIGSFGGYGIRFNGGSAFTMNDVQFHSAHTNYSYIRLSDGFGASRFNNVKDCSGLPTDIQAILTAHLGLSYLFPKYSIHLDNTGANDWEVWFNNPRFEYATNAAVKTDGFPGQIHIFHGKLNGGTTTGRVFDLDGAELFLEHGFSEGGAGLGTEAVYINNVVGNTYFYSDNWYFQTQDINIQNGGTKKIRINLKSNTFRDLTIPATTNIEELTLIENDITSIGINPFAQILNSTADVRRIYGNWHVSPTTGLKIPINYEEMTLGSVGGQVLSTVTRSGVGSSPSAINHKASKGTQNVPVNSSNGDELHLTNFYGRSTTDKVFATLVAAVVNAASQFGSWGIKFDPLGVEGVYFTFSPNGMSMPITASATLVGNDTFFKDTDNVWKIKDSSGSIHSLW